VFRFGGDDDWRSVVVRTADEDDIFPETSEVTYIKVAWDVGSEVP
jgi:hypothetical protein